MPADDLPQRAIEPDLPVPPLQAEPRLLPRWQRLLLMVLAWTSLGIGLLGVLVPGLPTTVFVLIAGWAAMHGSPRLHDWLLAHRVFGPMIRDWRREGAVSRRVKWMASASMSCCAAALWVFALPRPVSVAATAIMLVIVVWLWRRPEPGAQ